jgi:hypothetical protein
LRPHRTRLARLPRNALAAGFGALIRLVPLADVTPGDYELVLMVRDEI